MASTDHRSAAEIEREIEAERSALTKTLDEIQDRLSFEALTNDMMGSLREHSGDIGRSVGRAVKDNPVPLALTALGLAWLAMNSRSSSGRSDYDYDEVPGRKYEVGRTPRPSTGYAAGTDPLELGSAPAATPRPVYDSAGRPVSSESYASDTDHGEGRWDRAKRAASSAGHAVGDRLRAGRDAASHAAHDARSRAAQASAEGRYEASRGMSSARHAADEARYRARTGYYGARASAEARARGAYASASELRERIMHGTQELSEQARARVLAARTRAYEAQLRAEHYAARGRDRAAALYEDQPLIGGVIALALGAAVGSLLPSTRREDEAFGRYRDELFEEAERIYRDERAKIEDVARKTADEAKRTARETAEDIRSEAETTARDAGEKTKEAAQHVADTAREEADKKNLGHG